MMFPRVHLNGTSKHELLEQMLAAVHAVRNALKIVQRAAPHARDYYVISDEAYAVARTEYEVRLSKLIEIKNELNEIATVIGSQ